MRRTIGKGLLPLKHLQHCEACNRKFASGPYDPALSCPRHSKRRNLCKDCGEDKTPMLHEFALATVLKRLTDKMPALDTQEAFRRNLAEILTNIGSYIDACDLDAKPDDNFPEILRAGTVQEAMNNLIGATNLPRRNRRTETREARIDFLNLPVLLYDPYAGTPLTLPETNRIIAALQWKPDNPMPVQDAYAKTPIKLRSFTMPEHTELFVFGTMITGGICVIIPKGEHKGHAFTASPDEIALQGTLT